jgi:hypothetical protein
MTRHLAFEWNPDKAEENLRKHHVSFQTAAGMLADEYAHRFHLEEFDELHSDEEDRYITTGAHPADRDLLLVVCWTPRQEATRIISARKAMRSERRRYESEIT